MFSDITMEWYTKLISFHEITRERERERERDDKLKFYKKIHINRVICIKSEDQISFYNDHSTTKIFPMKFPFFFGHNFSEIKNTGRN